MHYEYKSDGGRATAGERARDRSIDDGGPRTPGRRWRRAKDGAIDRPSGRRRRVMEIHPYR